MKKKKFFIEKYPIQESGRTFILAEAGVNHNQRLDYALKLVDIAADAGADAVKFQTFKAEQVVTEQGKMASYQVKNIGNEMSQREMLQRVELPEKFYPQIIKRCQEKNILFLSTPHGGKASVDLLESLGVIAYKIGSGDLTNYILLDRVARTKKPMILSSGMATLQEVKDAISFINSRGNTRIALLHATTNYPCPSNEVNLLAMKTMMNELNVPVGYSDHTEGIQVSIMTAALGAAVYECHFTIDKQLSGPDHIASCTPEELKERIKAIRIAKTILGVAQKRAVKSELASMLALVRRSIVAARDLKKGAIITYQDLEAKRPGDGISPKEYEQFIGRKIKRDISIDEQIFIDDIVDKLY
jgi:N,N'-diacetyllegionaminate synthase